MPAEQRRYSDICGGREESWGNPERYIAYVGFEHPDTNFPGLNGKCPRAFCSDNLYILCVSVLMHSKGIKAGQSWFRPATSAHGHNICRTELIYC